MTYSIDNITAKLYFKIHETNEFHLLSDDDKIDCFELWEEIVDADNKISGNKKPNQIFNLRKKIKELDSKFNCLENALFYLKYNRDSGLESLVKSFRYKLSEANFKEDVLKNLIAINSIKNKISKYQIDIDNLQKIHEAEETTYEERLMSYYAIIGVSLSQPSNEVLLVDFRGLEKQVKNKIKSVENGKG